MTDRTIAGAGQCPRVRGSGAPLRTADAASPTDEPTFEVVLDRLRGTEPCVDGGTDRARGAGSPVQSSPEPGSDGGRSLPALALATGEQRAAWPTAMPSAGADPHRKGNPSPDGRSVAVPGSGAEPEPPQPSVRVVGLTTARGGLCRSLPVSAPARPDPTVQARAGDEVSDGVSAAGENSMQVDPTRTSGSERRSLPIVGEWPVPQATGHGWSSATTFEVAPASLDAGGSATPWSDPVPWQASPPPAWAVTIAGGARLLRVLTVAVEPADLGRVDVRLKLEGRALTVELSAAEARTSALLRAEQGALAQVLAEAGYVLESLSTSDGGLGGRSVQSRASAARSRAPSGSPEDRAPRSDREGPAASSGSHRRRE